MTTNPNFVQFFLTGNAKSTDSLADSTQFLQGQLTINTSHITEQFTPTAICNLKGRVHFGLWIKRAKDGFLMVLSADLAEDFKAHIKKYGAFSKISLSEPVAVYPVVIDGVPSFGDVNQNQQDDWQKSSIETGNYWITKATSELFQPQELRLHQRGGVDFDKGCYLGQEIVARLWFKAAPKAWLHHICYEHALPEDIGLINSAVIDGVYHALVVARPDTLTAHPHITIIALPSPLDKSVSRETNS